MGRPSTRQVAEAIVDSARNGESIAEFDARLAGLSRLSDEELAAIGITPRAVPETQGVPKRAKVTKLTKLTTPRFDLPGRFFPRFGRGLRPGLRSGLR